MTALTSSQKNTLQLWSAASWKNKEHNAPQMKNKSHFFLFSVKQHVIFIFITRSGNRFVRVQMQKEIFRCCFSGTSVGVCYKRSPQWLAWATSGVVLQYQGDKVHSIEMHMWKIVSVSTQWWFIKRCQESTGN